MGTVKEKFTFDLFLLLLMYPMPNERERDKLANSSPTLQCILGVAFPFFGLAARFGGSAACFVQP